MPMEIVMPASDMMLAWMSTMWSWRKSNMSSMRKSSDQV
jgi:hypothetical protein